MPRSETLAMLGTRFLYRHVRIAEPDDDNLSSRILDVHRALLPLARSVERLVERHLFSVVGVTFFREGGFH